MNLMEIFLLIAGVIVFIVSFLLPEGKNPLEKETKDALNNEVQKLVSKEMEQVKNKVSEVVDETVTYAVEKSERSLERISNEKIMAVNEYSDTVLDEIHKNHEEVVFLYDMLNQKQKNIKKTVSEVEQTVKEVEKSVKDTKKEKPLETKELKPISIKQESTVIAAVEKPKKESASKKKKTREELPEVDLSFIESTKKNGRNNNELILALHKEGKSNIAIAKELNLGVGEVKLVLDLFKGM